MDLCIPNAAHRTLRGSGGRESDGRDGRGVRENSQREDVEGEDRKTSAVGGEERKTSVGAMIRARGKPGGPSEKEEAKVCESARSFVCFPSPSLPPSSARSLPSYSPHR